MWMFPKRARQFRGLIPWLWTAAFNLIVGNHDLLVQLILLLSMALELDKTVRGCLFGRITLQIVLSYFKRCGEELTLSSKQEYLQHVGIKFFLHGDWRSIFATHSIVWNATWSGIIKSANKSMYRLRPERKPPDSYSKLPTAPVVDIIFEQ